MSHMHEHGTNKFVRRFSNRETQRVTIKSNGKTEALSCPIKTLSGPITRSATFCPQYFGRLDNGLQACRSLQGKSARMAAALKAARNQGLSSKDPNAMQH